MPEELIEKKAKIKELRATNEENIKRQVELYRRFIQELDILKFIVDNRYYFTHPKFNEISLRGPILGKDERKNILYVYDMSDNWVKEINMYNTEDEPKHTSLNRYFTNFDFEVAMEGLLHLVNFQDEVIKELEKNNEEVGASLIKYEKLIIENS